MLDWPLEIRRKERRWTPDSGVLFFCTVFVGKRVSTGEVFVWMQRTKVQSERRARARERRQNDRISRSFVSAGQANRRAVACWQLQQRRRRTRLYHWLYDHNTVVRNYEQTSNDWVCSIKYKSSCHHHRQVSAQRNTKVHFTSTTSGTALQCRWH